MRKAHKPIAPRTTSITYSMSIHNMGRWKLSMLPTEALIYMLKDINITDPLTLQRNWDLISYNLQLTLCERAIYSAPLISYFDSYCRNFNTIMYGDDYLDQYGDRLVADNRPSIKKLELNINMLKRATPL